MPAFPVYEPYDSGLLDVGDGQRLYWEQCGDPGGIPVLRVHGGPGSGCTVGQRGSLDPAVFRTILFDQRNCGRSLPNAADPAVDLSSNTTSNLIADMERLREHLGIEQWILYGGSWGSTLIVAYAEEHPERVKAAVVIGVTTTRRSEIAWLYEGVGGIFPEEWERFRDHVPAHERGEDVFGLIAAYGRLAADPDPAVRAAAVASWMEWEDTVISMEVNGSPGAYAARADSTKPAFVRICAHYFSNGAFLEEGQLLREAGRLAGIPAVLIHGRFDLDAPLVTAWELSHAWPGTELVVVEDSGHTGSKTMYEAVGAAFARFAQL